MPMDPTTAAALINVGSSAANQAGSFLGELFFGSRNQDFAREQATTAYQRQQALLQSQKEYDTPSAQMQRYIDAGLNPNLIYKNENLAPPVPSVAQGDVPVMSNPITGIDTSSLLQSQLARAQIRELQNKSDLTEAQAYQIYKITPIQFDQIRTECDRLRQLMDSESFNAALNRLKTYLLENDGYVQTNSDAPQSVKSLDGSFDVTVLSSSFRQAVLESEIKQLMSTTLDYDLAYETFLSKVGLLKADLTHRRLENKDLQAFVDVCARIYNSDATTAEYAASISELNQQFYNKIGASNDVIKLVFSFLSTFIQGLQTSQGFMTHKTKVIK